MLVFVGVLDVDVKPFGPVHAYVAPATAGVLRFRSLPTQSGVFPVATGVAGIGFTTTFRVPAALVHPFTVIVTE